MTGGEKVIDITSILTSPREDFENLFDRTNDIILLINERLKDINSLNSLREKTNLPEKELFRKYSSPDTIVIDGRRGTGKTTHLLTLKTKIEENPDLNKELKVLDVIDPTNVSEKIDILQVFLANIQTEIETNYHFFCRYGKEDLARNVLRNVKNLSKELIKLSTDKFLETEDEAAKTLRIGTDTSFEIHKIARDVCKLFEKKTLILPIDDIDMNLLQAKKVLDFVKENFSTPYVIPIIALDLSQALAIIKNHKYKFFGVKLWEKPSEKVQNLRFLDKLPGEWLQKIFSPSKRVVLPDVLNIYRDYLESKKRGNKIYFVYGIDKKVKLEFSEAVALMLSIVYEWNNIKTDDPSSYYVKNYLEGRSIRDFLNDLRALMRGILRGLESDVFGEKTPIKYNFSDLKDRFKPYSLYKEESPEDAIGWFWKSFVKVFNRRKKEGDIKNLKDIVREVIKIANEENEIVSRLEKTYYRILLQQIYTESIEIGIYKDQNGYIRVSRLIDESGNSLPEVYRHISLIDLLKLAFKTLLPAYLFFWAVKRNYISSVNFDISEFSDLFSSLKEEEVYDALRDFYKSVLTWHIKYPASTQKDLIPFCSIPLGAKKEFQRNRLLTLTQMLLKIDKNWDMRDIFLEDAYSPDSPTTPITFFSPFKFWFRLFVENSGKYYIRVRAPWSFGIALVRIIIKHYIINLVDGLFNFNKNFSVRFNLFPSPYIYGLLYERTKKINSELKELHHNLDKSPDKLIIKFKLNNIRSELLRIKSLRISSYKNSPMGKFEKEIESLINEINAENFIERNLKKRIENFYANFKNFTSNELHEIIREAIFAERAIFRAILSANYLPIHHVTKLLLRYADIKPCETMHTGYWRFGFRPVYEEDIHELKWDPISDLECLEETAKNTTSLKGLIFEFKNLILSSNDYSIRFTFLPGSKKEEFENEKEETRKRNIFEKLEKLERKLIEKYIEIYKSRPDKLTIEEMEQMKKELNKKINLSEENKEGKENKENKQTRNILSVINEFIETYEKFTFTYRTIIEIL